MGVIFHPTYLGDLKKNLHFFVWDYNLEKMSTFGSHRLDWLVVSKVFLWNAK
jgi:hypothetical protein